MLFGLARPQRRWYVAFIVSPTSATSPTINPYDRSAKVLFQERPADFLALVFPGIQAHQIRAENAQLNLTERRADNVCVLDEETAVLVEFMIAPDKRELRFFFTKAGMLAEALDKDVLLLVYYLTSGGYVNMPGEYQVRYGPIEQRYQFTTVSLWEHATAIRAGQCRALAPFLTLWSTKEQAQAETLATVRDLVLQEPDSPVRRDLLSIAVTVAERTIQDKKWLLEFFREEWTMIKESTIVDDWIQEGVQQGLQQGLQQGRMESARNSVIEVLKARFELVPADIIDAMGRLSTVAIVDQLIGLAVKAADLNQFRDKLKLLGA